MSVESIIQEINGREFVIGRDFSGKDIISIEQFTLEDVMQVMGLADIYKKQDERGSLEFSQILKRKQIAVCFYQPSTRTYLSFMAAGQKMGASMLGYPGMVEYSSANKGESLEDTIKTIEALGCHAIVLRHPDDDSSLIAAKAAEVPIISGGSGKLEHPTTSSFRFFHNNKRTT